MNENVREYFSRGMEMGVSQGMVVTHKRMVEIFTEVNELAEQVTEADIRIMKLMDKLNEIRNDDNTRYQELDDFMTTIVMGDPLKGKQKEAILPSHLAKPIGRCTETTIGVEADGTA